MERQKALDGAKPSPLDRRKRLGASSKPHVFQLRPTTVLFVLALGSFVALFTVAPRLDATAFSEPGGPMDFFTRRDRPTTATAGGRQTKSAPLPPPRAVILTRRFEAVPIPPAPAPDANSASGSGGDIIPELVPPRRTIRFRRGETEKSSHHYERHRKKSVSKNRCAPAHDWMDRSFPTCNSVHEFDLSDSHPGQGFLINNGHFRDVWVIEEYNGAKRVLKTLRTTHDFDYRSYDKERKDAVAMERLTSSPYIPEIFGYCFTSGLFELAPHADLLTHIRTEKWRDGIGNSNKLKIAHQVASALADVHELDIAHTDIASKQYILINGIYKLNDFNRCTFMTRDRKTHEKCTFYVGKNPGVSRSPEEYEYKHLTEKIDVYSMGNIFYSLLMGFKVFTDVRSSKAQKIVMAGGRPKLSEEIEKSSDPFEIVLLHAMRMCQAQDRKERASAREVVRFLDAELDRLSIERSPISIMQHGVILS